MAKLQINIDTNKKEEATVKIDGEVIENLHSVSIFGIDEPDFMFIELSQFIPGEKEGDFRKSIRMTASENKWQVDDGVNREEIASLLMRLDNIAGDK